MSAASAKARKRRKVASRALICPSCAASWATRREALVCWLGHDPDLATDLTLEQIARPLWMTRERVRQLLNELGEHRRRRQVRYPPPDVSRPAKTYATNITEERRERWRVYQRERYRNDPTVRAAVKLRYEERWKSEPAFREAHRRRARERYWRLKAERERREREGEEET